MPQQSLIRHYNGCKYYMIFVINNPTLLFVPGENIIQPGSNAFDQGKYILHYFWRQQKLKLEENKLGRFHSHQMLPTGWLWGNIFAGDVRGADEFETVKLACTCGIKRSAAVIDHMNLHVVH